MKEGDSNDNKGNKYMIGNNGNTDGLEIVDKLLS